MIKRQPKCKCGKFLANFGRSHGDGSIACDIWRETKQSHGVQEIAPGPYNVYSDGDGHYAVMASDRRIVYWSIASDCAQMKALEFNREIAKHSLEFTDRTVSTRNLGQSPELCLCGAPIQNGICSVAGCVCSRKVSRSNRGQSPDVVPDRQV